MEEQRANKPVSLTPVLMVHFIGTMGYSIVLPFLVFLVVDFGGNEVIYGIMGSVYPLMQFFGAPLLGKWSDRFGRRKILFVSQLGTFLAWVIFIVAMLIPQKEYASVNSGILGDFTITLPLLLLFIARALDGITGGNISVANAYVSDISDDANRKQNFGKMAMAASMGFIVGPAIAGVLGSSVLQELLPVSAAASIAILALILIYFYLPESKPCVVKPDFTGMKLRKIFALEQKGCFDDQPADSELKKSVFSYQHVTFMVFYYFLVFLGFSFFYSAFPIHASTALNWDTLELGIFFSILSGLMIVSQGPLMGLLSKRYNESNLIVTGSLLLTVNFVLMNSSDTFSIYAGAVFFAVGNGIMWPSYLSILAKVGGKTHQGEVQGVANSAGSLASIFGLVAGGFLYALVGSYTFLLAAFTMFIIFMVSFRLIRINKDLAQA